MRTHEQNADVICEALQREANLMKRFGRHRVILEILKGAKTHETLCGQCKGVGSTDVVCESSGGSLYSETRGCYECKETGRVRRLLVRGASFVGSTA